MKNQSNEFGTGPTELDACPFCRADVRNARHISWPCRKGWLAECEPCGVTMVRALLSELVEDWNERGGGD